MFLLLVATSKVDPNGAINRLFDEISFILNMPNRFLEYDSLPVGRLTKQNGE